MTEPSTRRRADQGRRATDWKPPRSRDGEVLSRAGRGMRGRALLVVPGRSPLPSRSRRTAGAIVKRAGQPANQGGTAWRPLVPGEGFFVPYAASTSISEADGTA